MQATNTDFEDTDNLNRLMTSKEIKIIKKPWQRKI